MESLKLSDSPPQINNIREKLASQISPLESPVSSAVENEKIGTAVDNKTQNIIDEFVGIDPAFILEDETSRNTQYNSMLYDQETDASYSNLVPDDMKNEDFKNEYRLMESASSLSLENDGLQRPTPVRPSNLVTSLLSSTNISPVLSLSGTPIRSNLKSPLSTSKVQFTNNSNYERRILFDTLNNKKANNLQMILRTKHNDYKYTRISRTFLCGYDDHEYSETALKWVVDELMADGDMIVCLKVIDKEDLNLSHNYQLENEKIMEKIMRFNKSDKKISILLEICVSAKVSKKILQAIKDYEPTLLIVGTSGVPKKGFKNIISPKSMSKYCLQYSEIPVVVVRPNYKPLLKTKSCISYTKPPLTHGDQSLDAIVMGSQSELKDDEDTPVVKIDKDFYKNLVLDFRPFGEQSQHQPDLVEERPTRTSRPRSSIFPRLLTPLRSHDSTPTTSGTEELLRPTRSRGFSPVRSLSPFWRKNNHS